ncbi:hypothetical protein LWE61_01825 [Sphingobium sufflavum]|uniref:carboxymuconolactone decarboxylase family protein n=1 Tax=Sphingobium sufflavum TaxID=1129547 RepID=UPI001F2E4621|nr:hypothetical protein [Sphingobium sufflavum]MCE7795290.1 hypothetical protein [Sphingobium sufflavum]
MARVQPVHTASDYRDDPADAAALFGTLFPGVAAPAFDANHDGMAIAALNPKLALTLAQTSRFLALDLEWCKRADLRELAIMTVNRHYGSTYSIRSREAIALAGGISADQAAALDDWRNSNLFDAEQRLVIDYAQTVLSGTVPAALFEQVKTAFGEKGAVEFTSVVGFWAFWAMFLNATRPDEG